MIRIWRLILMLLSFESFSQQVIINEFFRPLDHSNGWIELANPAGALITIGGFKVMFYNQNGVIMSTLYFEDNLSIDSLGLQTIEIPPSHYQNFDSVHYALLVNSESSIVDSLSLVNGLQENESIGRYPDFHGIFLHSANLSPGKLNPDPGPWLKRANKTSFGPRDSSPNACIVFNDTVWVFAGWRNQADEWFSKSDVYNSGDAINWKLVNANPPYDPYSAFVSFKGKMWAFHVTSFCSTNGKEWSKVESNVQFKPATKFAVFKDILWAVSDKTIWTSTDGINWQTVTESAPWLPRTLPGFVVCQDRLWFFGGGIGYGTWGQDYYLNDVWYTEDGATWQLATNNANWPGRYWFSTQSYNDMLFIFGGWSFFEWASGNNGNLNDVWFSEDGIEWKEWQGAPWPKRHAQFSFVFDNSLWLSSGYGTEGQSTLYNDVWQLNAKTYFSKDTGELTDLGTWNTRMDGMGNTPTSFKDDNSIFFLTNRGHSQLSGSLDVTGNRSQFVITKDQSLTVDQGSSLQAVINLDVNSRMEFRSDGFQNFHFLDPSSTIVYDMANSDIIVRPASFPNLILKNAQKLSFEEDSVLANGNISFENISLTNTAAEKIHIDARRDISIDTRSNLANNHISVSLIGQDKQSVVNESEASVYFNHLETRNSSSEIKFCGSFIVDSVLLDYGQVQLTNANLSFGKIRSAGNRSYFITDSLSHLRTVLEKDEKLFPLGTSDAYNPIFFKLNKENVKQLQDTVIVQLVPTNAQRDTLDIAWKIENLDERSEVAVRVKWELANENENFSGHYKKIINLSKEVDSLFCTDEMSGDMKEVDGLIVGNGTYTVISSTHYFKKSQSANMADTLNLAYGDVLSMPVMSSVNIPLKYDYSDKSLLLISNGTLHALQAGQAIITVKADSNECYQTFNKLIPVKSIKQHLT